MRFIASNKWFSTLLLASLLGLGLSASAQEIRSVESAAVKIADGVYLLNSLQCNVVAVIGPDGILLIDNGSAGRADNLKEMMAGFDTGALRIIVNTHYHFDHIGNNELLTKNGVVIVAHVNTRRRMLAEWRIPDKWGLYYPAIPPYPEVAVPKVTFVDTLNIHFNGQKIEAVHFPNAHSDADIAVFLRDTNVLHTGDIYLSNGFPIIDSFHGGTIDGVIAAVDALVDLINDHTKVVPGHGPVSNRQELRDYRKMLTTARDRIAALIEEGKTLEEIVAADPTAGFYRRGRSWLPPKLFIVTVYADLSRGRSPKR